MGGIGTLGLVAFKTIILNELYAHGLEPFRRLERRCCKSGQCAWNALFICLMKVFLDLLEYLNFIQIDFGLVGVTCRASRCCGLLTNVAIVGFVIIYIESEIQYTQELLFASSDHSLSYKLSRYLSTRVSGLDGWKSVVGSCMLWGAVHFWV